MSTDAAIVTYGLGRRFGGVQALHDITLSVPSGAHVALVGPNGSGKSTLLAVLSTLYRPSSGSAAICGFDLRREGDAIRHRLGVVAHRPMLYEALTPLENLRFFARLYRVPDQDTRIEELLRAFGLWRRRHEPTAQLSRGYHQRLALARALVHAPELLLLDEPETGLDAEGLLLLDELAFCAAGVTVLAATHRHDLVGRWADAEVRLERGRLSGTSGLERPLALVRDERAS